MLACQTSKFTPPVRAEMPLPPLLHTQRLLKGSGHEWGGLVTEVHNNHRHSSVRVLYLDTIPWYFRVFIHTLSVQNGEPII